MNELDLYKQNIKELQEQLQNANIRIAELYEELSRLKLVLKMMRGV